MINSYAARHASTTRSGTSATTRSTTIQIAHEPLHERVVRARARRAAGGLLPEQHRRLVHDASRATQGSARPPTSPRSTCGPNYIPVLMRELYPHAKEIFLVRDFRDMVLSILAFDRKRGFPGFGRPEGTTDEQYVRDGAARDGAQTCARAGSRARDGSHLVRYEDLVLRPLETLPRHARVPGAGRLAASGRASSCGVRRRTPTSCATTAPRATREESIGRWRREGDERFPRPLQRGLR